MPKKKKMSLSPIKIRSFVTSLNNEEKKKVKGGLQTDERVCLTESCVVCSNTCDTCNCGTDTCDCGGGTDGGTGTSGIYTVCEPDHCGKETF